MQKVYTFSVGKINIEYFEGDAIYLYNPANQRMVEVNKETLEYIKTYDSCTDSVPAVEKFLFSKKIKSSSDIRVLNLELDHKYIAPIISFFNISYMKYFFLLMIISFLISIPFVLNKASGIYFEGLNQFSIWDIILVYMLQLLITFFHELGHYITYSRNILNEKIRFGIVIRYLFLFMFYTNVNYMRNLKKTDRIWIIISGVLAQGIIGGILAIFILSGYSYNFLYYTYFVNLTVILINILPFIKLDGYWLINEIINSEDYMKKFYNFVVKKEEIRFAEFILSILNIIVIILIIFGGLKFISILI